MLSRHAEHLFWTGRYVERAADTARMLDVTYHGLLGSPPAETRQGWLDLLAVLHSVDVFTEHHAIVEARGVSNWLVLDVDNPGAIVNSVSRARENARSVRELVSTELWESINTFWLELQARDLRRDLDQQPYELYRLVRRRCQEVTGTAAETMPHDDGWRFLTLGLMLERAAMTCRLLNVRSAPFTEGSDELGFHAAVQVLKSASASEAFRKAHPAAMTLHNVVQFLLLSPEFPRSVLFCLRAAEQELMQLDEVGRQSRALRVLGRRRADLEFADVVELLASDLHAFLDDVQDDIRRASDLVAVQFFRHADDFAVFHSLERIP
jgi:uncharacterized alpha-E superfamily protein